MASGSPRINPSSFPGPETIARRVFPNGVIGLAQENFSSPSVIVHGWIWVGSIDVPPEQAGLASLTASMLTRGSARRSFAQIGEEIESLGASLSVGSSGHTTRFTAKCLAEDLPTVLDILTDCLYHPTFPPEHVEKRRGEILTTLRQREHNTQAMASLRFGELMYPNHPYGRSQLGYQETVEKITRQDVVAFYRDHYGARGMVVVVVGAIAREKGLDMLQQAMGAWQGATHIQSQLPAISPIAQTREVRTTIPGKTQSDIVLGWIGLERKNPDFLKTYLADCILGRFGMMGRIGEQVRDEQGLAYYAGTSLDAGLGPGPWAIVAAVAPDNIERTIQAILAEVERLQNEPVGEREFADNVAYIIDSMPLRLEGKEGIAAQIANMEMYQLGLDYLRRFPSTVEALTPEDVMAAAHTYMNPDAYILSIAGPLQREEP